MFQEKYTFKCQQSLMQKGAIFCNRKTGLKSRSREKSEGLETGEAGCLENLPSKLECK